MLNFEKKKKVILITDGDIIAKNVVEEVAKKINGRCITLSGGNPTQLSGEEIIEMIKSTPTDPVLVMFDDNGNINKGYGEKALEFIAKSPFIEVLGAIAVASNTKDVKGTDVNCSVDCKGEVIEDAVNKEGERVNNSKRIYGDTVDVLNKLNIPFIVGIGDIGKMNGKDNRKLGAPITYQAIRVILDRSVHNEEEYEVK